MKRSIPVWQTAGFIFTAVLGTFLHFLFDLTGGSLFAALFSPVNESIWEHMKLSYGTVCGPYLFPPHIPFFRDPVTTAGCDSDKITESKEENMYTILRKNNKEDAICLLLVSIKVIFKKRF